MEPIHTYFAPHQVQKLQAKAYERGITLHKLLNEITVEYLERLAFGK